MTVLTANLGGAVAWIVPSYKNSRPLWRFVRRAVSSAAAAGVVRVSETSKIVEFPSGGRLQIFSAENPDSIRGEDFDLAVVDEAARVSDECIYDALEPALADRDGQALYISTPRGVNWFFDEYERGRKRMDEQAAAWSAPSIANPNPHIQRAAEAARLKFSERTYRQEWLGEFVADGEVFRGVDRCVGDVTLGVGRRMVWGIDWAKEQDWTVVVAYDVVSRCARVLYRQQRKPYLDMIEEIEALDRRYRPGLIVVEENSIGGPLLELLQGKLPNGLRRVEPFDTNPVSKPAVIDELALAFEQRTIIVPDDDVLLGELRSYQAKRRADGGWSYSAPEGRHDDTVMALALAWYAGQVSRVGRLGGVRA